MKVNIVGRDWDFATQKTIRTLSCGHKQVEVRGGYAPAMTKALCKECGPSKKTRERKRKSDNLEVRRAADLPEVELTLREISLPKPVIVKPPPDKYKYRKMFRPKYPVCEKPCASCPFRQGNTAEWSEAVAKLARVTGVRPPSDTEQKRDDLILDFDTGPNGDFMCHHTVYTPGFEMKKPISEHRQCAGAMHLWKTGERFKDKE